MGYVVDVTRGYFDHLDVGWGMADITKDWKKDSGVTVFYELNQER